VLQRGEGPGRTEAAAACGRPGPGPGNREQRAALELAPSSRLLLDCCCVQSEAVCRGLACCCALNAEGQLAEWWQAAACLGDRQVAQLLRRTAIWCADITSRRPTRVTSPPNPAQLNNHGATFDKRRLTSYHSVRAIVPCAQVASRAKGNSPRSRPCAPQRRSISSAGNSSHGHGRPGRGQLAPALPEAVRPRRDRQGSGAGGAR
jgi:hypothetical protein